MIGLASACGGEPALAHELGEQLACGGRPRSAPPKSGYSFASVLKQCGQLATIFVTPASFSVATFCSAYAWKTYSLPIRRAGSPVHASRGPRIAKSTPAACSSFAVDSARRPRALVERRGAADPVEVLRRRVAGLEHAHAELLRPRRALGLRLAPRVAARSTSRSIGSASAGKLRLDHHAGCGAGRRCGRCARSRPGTPRRTRRR